MQEYTTTNTTEERMKEKFFFSSGDKGAVANSTDSALLSLGPRLAEQLSCRIQTQEGICPSQDLLAGLRQNLCAPPSESSLFRTNVVPEVLVIKLSPDLREYNGSVNVGKNGSDHCRPCLVGMFVFVRVHARPNKLFARRQTRRLWNSIAIFTCERCRREMHSCTCRCGFCTSLPLC